jgi:phosphoglycolate phosphatase
MISPTVTSPTVVFDLDGTLVDTAPDLVATLNHVFAREGLPPVAYDSARNMVGGGARVMIERGLKAEGRMLPVAETDRLVRDFVEHYAAHIADHSRPFDGVEAALDELANAGCRFAVCTNKLEWLSIRLLDALGLSARFAAICGADTFGTPKPNPAILLGTIERAGGDRDRTVMVGDSITDIATARAAAVPVIAVDFGYTDTPVRDLNPDRVVGAFADVPALVFDLLGGRPGEFTRKR